MPHKNFISFCCLPLNLKMIYDIVHSIPIDLECYQYYILIHIYTQISLRIFKNNSLACSSTTTLFLNYFGSYQYYSFFLFFLFCFVFWLHWVFFAVHWLSLVVVSRGYSWLWCAGFSLRRAGFSSCDARA